MDDGEPPVGGVAGRCAGTGAEEQRRREMLELSPPELLFWRPQQFTGPAPLPPGGAVPITLRLRDVPPALESRFRETIENALEGDWSVTLSQSHLDGQWHLQLDGASDRYRVVLPALEGVRLASLHHLLQQLVETEEVTSAATGGAEGHPG